MSFFIMNETIFYFFAVFIGVILGLIGAGGSILTLPFLTYLVGIEPILATSYSLFIVGITSFFGALTKIKEGNIDKKIALYFSIPSLLSVYFTRKIIIPSIPDIIINFNGFIISKNTAIMVLFSFIMFFAALSMIGLIKGRIGKKQRKNNVSKIIIEGVLIGLFTGLVGAGGGFIIIPTLVLFSGLSMKKAVGTSLTIIAVKSLFGFIGDISNSLNISWDFLLPFCLLSIIGMFIGVRVGRGVDGDKLKKHFGYFILIMSFFIILKETL